MAMFSPARRPEPSTSTPAAPDTSNGAPSAPGIPLTPQRSAGGVLSAGVSITGSLKFGRELQVDCEVEGTIDSEGRLVVEKNAQIRGEIRAGSVTVFGTVEGNVTATERCELRAGCTLRGDIEAPRLVVDDDATFVGSAKITKRA
ncbi:MAG: bactofilin family protein [Chthoniobacterales bacterium]